MTISNRIGTYNFRVLTEGISEMFDLGVLSLESLYGMNQDLQLSRANTNSTAFADLQNAIIHTYGFILNRHINNIPSIIDAVVSLNLHIRDTYGVLYEYQNMDEFLLDQYLSVPVTYADLANYAGFSITVIGSRKGLWQDVDDLWPDVTLTYEEIGSINL